MSREVIADLRSDTVTRPSAAMRRAMAEAEVGDDGFGEDPSVRRLEERGAELLGTEASLFVPSGVMGNQIALHLLGRPGAEVVCEASCHLVDWELGAMAVFSGLTPRTVRAEGGLLDPRAVEAVIHPAGGAYAPTAVLAIENTHNMAGGRVYSPERLAALLEVARRHRLAAHLDGARLFNAAVALGVAPARLTRGFDSVMVCLSKGLGAPAGSLLGGDRAFVAAARIKRKMFGGTMRQVGVLAAAALVALDEGIARLAEDHRNARWLAEELDALPGAQTRPQTVETNIVMLRLPADESASPDAPPPAVELRRRLAERGVLSEAVDLHRLRLVTHRDCARERLERALEVFRSLLGRRSAAVGP